MAAQEGTPPGRATPNQTGAGAAGEGQPERDLETLLATVEVHRHGGLWAYGKGDGGPNAVFRFTEREGPCHIAPVGPSDETPADGPGDRAEADRSPIPSASGPNRWVWLELTVYSDLHAVGFLAAVALALADEGVPCNAIAGLHHDHVFVPEALADRAVEAINALRQTR